MARGGKDHEPAPQICPASLSPVKPRGGGGLPRRHATACRQGWPTITGEEVWWELGRGEGGGGGGGGMIRHLLDLMLAIAAIALMAYVLYTFLLRIV